MRRYWYLAIAGAIAAIAVVPMTAFAATGTNSGNVTFVNTANSNQFASCSTSTITVNGSVPNETVSSQTFSGCTLHGVAFGGIQSISSNASTTCPWNASLNGTTVTISPNGGSGCSGIVATVVATVFGNPQTPCHYSPHAAAGTITGTTSNGGSTVVFSNQQFDKTDGPGTCFASAFFNATYNIA